MTADIDAFHAWFAEHEQYIVTQPFAEFVAAAVWKAGWAQALEDAARVCDQRAKEMWGFTEEEHASEACAAAIRALATQAQRETP